MISSSEFTAIPITKKKKPTQNRSLSISGEFISRNVNIMSINMAYVQYLSCLHFILKLRQNSTFQANTFIKWVSQATLFLVIFVLNEHAHKDFNRSIQINTNDVFLRLTSLS